MPHHCCVPFCTKSGYRAVDGRAVSFHKFPTDKRIRLSWIHAIRRDLGSSFKLTDHTKVCSLHFNDDDYVKNQFSTKRNLLPHVTPSIFSWNTITTTPKRKPPSKRRLDLEYNADLNTQDSSKNEEETIEDILRKEKDELQEQVNNLKASVSDVKKQLEELENIQQQLRDAKVKAENSLNFRLSTFKDDDDAMEFYTGFTYESFCIIYSLIDPGPAGENIELYARNKCASVHTPNHNTDHSYCDAPHPNPKGPSPVLPHLEQFFLTLVRLRTGFSELHLAHLFQISCSTVSRYVISWVNYMFLKLGSLNIWLDRDTVSSTMPDSFKKKFPTSRVIIDCTEIKTETPSTLVLNSEMFSQYKNACTVKGLVGIAPSGAVTFVSKLYTGSISDRKITEESGILDMDFADNDVVMADKGFVIDDLLSEEVDAKNVRLNIPPFLERKGQFSEEEVLATQEIAAERIHVERAINKIKNFHIFDIPIPLNMTGSINQIWSVCAVLTNFQNPLLSDHPVCIIDNVNCVI